MTRNAQFLIRSGDNLAVVVIILLSETLVYTVLSNKCLTSTSIAMANQFRDSVCALNHNTVSRQCDPDDLTLIKTTPLVAYDQQTFWITRGDLCSKDTCEALVFNSSDVEATTYIACRDCNEQHGAVCDPTGAACDPKGANVTTGKYAGCTPNDWLPHDDMEFFISPVRRTLADSHQWCLENNGTDIDHQKSLRSLDNLPFPEPILKTYWLGVPIQHYHNGKMGVLVTSLNRGDPLTQNLRILFATKDEFSQLYGCICIRKQRQSTTPSATIPSTALFTPPPTTATITTTTSTTGSTSTATTTTKSTSTVPARPVDNQPGVVVTGKYTNIPTNNGLMKKPGVVTQFSVRRSSECAMKCNRTSGCRAYFYDKLTSTCQLLDGNNPTADCDSVPSAKYYVEQ